MINPLPWTMNDERDDSGIIRDANGEVIAKDYTFLNLDDFEAICEMVNESTSERAKSNDQRTKK